MTFQINWIILYLGSGKLNQERSETMENSAYDYSKLRGRIREVYGSEAAFAEAMNLTRPAMSARLNNVSGFRQSEIVKATELLKINTSEMGIYFFAPLVQKS